jgi:hypothetical protein
MLVMLVLVLVLLLVFKLGATWRLAYINNVAFALTLTAPDTSVVVTSPTVNASSVKEVLVTIVNGTPQQQIGNCSTTNGSAVVTGMSAAQTSSYSWYVSYWHWHSCFYYCSERSAGCWCYSVC